MKRGLALLSGFLLAMGFLAVEAQQAKKPPEKIVFTSKMGNVTFQHAKHIEREKANCKTCHEQLFPQSNAPLDYKANMHKTAEASKTACAACHVPGGKSFETKGNCQKCHVKG